MRYLEHVTTDGERWDNLAALLRRCAGLRTHHRGQSARRYYAGFTVRRAADHPGYQRHANDPGATAMAEITVSGGVFATLTPILPFGTDIKRSLTTSRLMSPASVTATVLKTSRMSLPLRWKIAPGAG